MLLTSHLPLDADQTPCSDLTLDGVTGKLTLGRDRQFVRELGMSFGEWRQRLRYLAAIEALDSERSVQNVAFDLGYSSASAFISMFRKMMGTTPDELRRGTLSAA